MENLNTLSDLSFQELNNISGGVNWCDVGVGVLGVAGMIAGGPVGVAIGLFGCSYSITRGICS